MIMRIPILKSILQNLDWFEEARRHHVAPDGSIFLGGANHRLKKDGDWEESKHPRADNGQFSSGSGTSHGKESQGAKRKRTAQARRAESAGQTQLGHTDHIQTLLSGGSALDKIGWLSTSKKPTAEKKPEQKPAQEKPKEEAARPKQTKPVLGRGEAEKFVADSKHQGDVYHVTTSQNAEKIRSSGFKTPKGASFGAEWGNGVYVATDKGSTDYYRRTTGMTDKTETMTLKARVKNPIKFDASGVESPEEGAGKIAEQIGQSREYDAELKRINEFNAKLYSEAEKKFGRPMRANDKRKGESNDAFMQRFEAQRQQYSDFMKERGYADSPSGEALTRIASGAGYDAIIINDREFRNKIGGNQMVVFDPKNVKVVEEGSRETKQPSTPEPETWYDSEKYRQAADTLLNNLKSGKVKIADAEKAHAAKNEEFMALARNKKRTEAEDAETQKLSNELGAMQHALNRYTRGEPDARRRRF